MSRPTFKMFTTIDATTPGGRYTLDGVAASDTSTYYSKKCVVGNPDNAIGFTLETTGTLTGTFTLWWAAKEKPDLTTDTDWEQDTGVTFTNPAGSPTVTAYSVTDIKGKWYRIRYVNASGTGTVYGWAVV